MNRRKREIEIAWTFLARSHWGGKYNGALKRLMLDHALKFVESVVFLIGPTNVRSQKALEKIGGVMIEWRQKTLRGKSSADPESAGQRRDGAMRREILA